MNFRVSLLVFGYFFTHVYCAIIPTNGVHKADREVKGDLSHENHRIYLGDIEPKLKPSSSTINKKEINRKLCDHCKKSDLCLIKGDCKHCTQFCKVFETESKRDVKVPRDADDDFLRAENEKDQTIVSRSGEILSENEQTGNRMEEEEDNSRQLVAEANEDILGNSHEENSGQLQEAEGKRGNSMEGRQLESRYYTVGVLHPGVSLSILLKLADLKQTEDINKAVILVKSKTPVHVDDNILDKIGDSAFLRILQKELDDADKKHGKKQMSVEEMNRLLEKAYAKAESQTNSGSHIVGMEHTGDQGGGSKETVGCSKEETESVPFFPIQPNLYRANTHPQPEKLPHKTVVVEPEEFYDSQENSNEKRSKNPSVIQDAPSLDSRSSIKSENHQNSARANELIRTINDDLKQLEKLDLVGSSAKEETHEEENQVGASIAGDRKEESSKSRENVEDLLGEEADENLRSTEDAEEEDDRERTHHKKKYKGESHSYGGHYSQPASYGHSNSYGHAGGSYREASDNTLGEKQDEAPKEDEDKSISQGKSREIVGEAADGASDENSSKVRSHKSKHGKHGSYGSSYRTNEDEETGHNQISVSDIKLESEREEEAEHSDDILGTKHKKNKKGGYYREGEDSISQEISGETRVKGDGMMLSSENVPKQEEPTVGINFQPEDSINLQSQNEEMTREEKIRDGKQEALDTHSKTDHKGTTSKFSEESVESNESSEIHHKKGHQLEHGAKDHHIVDNQDPKNEDTNPRPKEEIPSIKDDMEKSLPGKTLIQIDDQLVDVPKEGKSIFQNEEQRRFSMEGEQDADNLVREEQVNPEQNEREENIVGAMTNLNLNPEIMSDPKGQNLGLVNNNHEDLTVRPEFPVKKVMPAKIAAEIPRAGVSISAPAFGENKKFIIDPPEFTIADTLRSAHEHLSHDEALTDRPVTEIKEGFVGAAHLPDSNIPKPGDVDPKNIDKLITPQEQEFLHNFGKIVPAAEKMHLNTNTDVYFMGNGIKLPLKVSQNRDGSLALAVDVEKLCECKNSTCIHRKGLAEFHDHFVGASNLKNPGPEDVTEKPMENDRDAFERIVRKARHHVNIPKLKTLRKHRMLHKRSIDDGRKEKNDLDNSLVKEKEPTAFSSKEEDIHYIKDIHKFKQVEKQLENKLENLGEKVENSNKQYSELLKKGTQDLLQIKNEDQVVKHRVGIVNDLLKWMKEMAEGVPATLNQESTTNKGL